MSRTELANRVIEAAHRAYRRSTLADARVIYQEPGSAEVDGDVVSLHSARGALARYRFRLDSVGRVRLVEPEPAA